VLVLDDLHAADTPSLLLLQFVARQLASSRVLLLGALRSLDPVPGQELTATLTEVAREPVTRRVSLGGLTEQEVAAFVELTAAEIATPELVAALHEQTEGNPLFVGETVSLLALEGDAARPSIPESVRAVIARRLAHLSAECNGLLVLASVLGREFALDALARMGDVSEEDVLDALDEAMAARVISDVPGFRGRLRFAHVLIRDTLYEELTTARRVRLHRLAVEALEALYGEEAGPHLAEFAYHAVAGSEFDKGVQYARRAGDRALELLAYEEAARLYETSLEALDLSSSANEVLRCELLLALGEAEIRAGDSRAAKKAFLAAAGLARRLGLARELARAAAGYGGRSMYSRAGADPLLVPLLEEGLAALPDDDVELRARLLARLAGALRDEPSRDRRSALSKEAVELARRAGDPSALAYALDGRAAAIIAPDTIEESLDLSRELIEVAESIGDGERVFYGRLNRFGTQLMTGNMGDAKANLAAMHRSADELRQPHQLFQAGAAHAMLALAEGRLAEASELSDQAVVHGERAQPEMATPIHQLQRYALADFQASLDRVEPAIHDLVAVHPARPVFRCLLGHLEARLGRLQEAKRTLADLVETDVSTVPFDQEWLLAMSLLAETATIVRDKDSAAVLYRLLLPWASLNVVDFPEAVRGSVARYLGMLAGTIGRWDDAARHFEDALEANDRMGLRPWLARTQEDYGRILLGRGHARGRELLDAALASYRELGMAASS
jgi:hypothetical protein